ncbi:transcription termination factor Rho [Jatrophihabitans sp. GAS493]|uniref:transcription termination factor Rho n=1 Tax=Jatrophihabitans sp. GAS493 TaxID=1907575 RepID=UPI000BB94333|nr:transcription termination factor Rho [Jatrophihabitans sp. GAS493]SOD73299.1 transcription termination factor Rho [Jatrophihabitans sp. GAS493]
MTDTNEQLVLASTSDAPRSAAGEPGNAPATEAGKESAKRRGGSLSSMLLPELQQLAGSMGISSAKLRKSDLVAAIQAGRSGQAGGGSASNSGSGSATKSRSARSEASSETSGPATEAASTAPRESAPDRDTANGVNGQAGEAPRSDDGERSQRPPRANRDRQNRQGAAAGGNAGQGASAGGNAGGSGNAGQSGNSGQSGNAGGNARAANAGGGNSGGGNSGGGNAGGGNAGGQNRQQNQSGQNRNNQNTGGNQNNGPSDDDEFEGGRRRGRRYRDRRGRNRERGVGGVGGNNDVEPTVSEDDILVPVAGIVDAIEDKNSWFVRTGGYFASSDDVYVSNTFVRRYGLRRGDAITGAIKQQGTGERREKYTPLVRLDTINGRDPEQSKGRVEFTKLTPLYPQQRLHLETESHILTTRVIDLVMPIGKGQRALIASPPKAGKTMVLQAIANAIATNNPEVHLMVVLVDERPEEVTDMQRSVKGEVIASTFDRRPQDHTMVAELAIERAKRLVEMGHDVVVLLDSITRLGRAYNLAAPASGRILSGGVDSTALYPPKRFLGAARNIENGGSLTILATALVETGSAGDSVIFEEFKGTGNAELKLDRKIADKRIFPAIDVDQSSTRKEELLLSPEERAVIIKLRRVLQSLEQQEAINLLLDRLKKTKNNAEFLMQIAKTTPGQD